jgi:hypothetical protein
LRRARDMSQNAIIHSYAIRIGQPHGGAATGQVSTRIDAN